MDNTSKPSSSQVTLFRDNFPKGPPAEILQLIFAHLDLHSMISLRLVNKRFKANVDALLKSTTHWIKSLSTLEPKAAIAHLKQLQSINLATELGGRETSLLSDDQMTEIWFKAAQGRRLSDRILMVVFCRQSKLLTSIAGSQLLIDFWWEIADEMDEMAGIHTAASAQDAQSLRYIDLFQIHPSFFACHTVFLNAGAPQTLLKIVDVMKALVMIDGNTLRFASESLRNNNEIVMAAVKQNGRALEHAGDQFKSNAAVVMAAVLRYGHALQYAGEQLKNNKAIVMAAVQQNGRALKYAAEEFKNNEAVVMAAVQKTGYSIWCASEEMRNNEAVVLEAVKQDTRALQFAGTQLTCDRDFLMRVVDVKPEASEYILEKIGIELDAARTSSPCP